MTDPFDIGDFGESGDASIPLSRRAAPGRAGAEALLEGLNPEQRQAVMHTEGPLLVLAGAGTGKTRALTTRLAYILATGRAWPGQILAVTFTNKAAREMKERIRSLIGDMVDGMAWLGTFHSIGVRLLQRHAEMAGLKSGFSILDTDDQVRLLKTLLAAENIDEKRFPARQMAALIDDWKNRGLDAKALPETEAAAFANGKAGKIYGLYQERLRAMNAVDFGDLLLLPLKLFQNDAGLLAEYRRRFRYMMVDEYQDTNVVQYMLLRLLAGADGNICCVGDDDQSIYGWRGARVENILRFERDFTGARVIRLERNYRSTGHILAAANGLIAHNRGRLGKELRCELGEGEKVLLRGHHDDMEEARAMGGDIEAAQARGASLSSMAVLVRASFQMRAIEECFMELGLPYQVIGGPRFYERAEIRDVLAYLKVIHSPAHDLALERIINVPRRGIGAASVKKLRKLADMRGMTLHEAAEHMAMGAELPARAANSLRALLADFARWREQAEKLPPGELAELVMNESGYREMWKSDKSPKAAGRLENLDELTRSLEEFDTLESFLEHVSLVMEAEGETSGGKVSLMTMHAAKGLEFEHVFLPGWEEGLFPHQRSLDESGEAGLEEERRLAYVAMTRAMRRAVISFAASRRVHGSWQNSLPSRFIDELPAAHVEVESPAAAHGASGYGASGYGAHGHGHGSSGYGAASAGGAAARWGRRGQRRDDESRFSAGQRVFHQKFGYGVVVHADGDKLTIDFDHTGEKRIMAGFVEAA